MAQPSLCNLHESPPGTRVASGMLAHATAWAVYPTLADMRRIRRILSAFGVRKCRDTQIPGPLVYQRAGYPPLSLRRGRHPPALEGPLTSWILHGALAQGLVDYP